MHQSGSMIPRIIRATNFALKATELRFVPPSVLAPVSTQRTIRDMTLYCSSCRRDNTEGPNGTKTVTFQGIVWCTSCAAVRRTSSGSIYVDTPSPGRMYEGENEDPIDAWEDCYDKKPKKRILKATAKTEIQRAWELWSGDKSSQQAKLIFFRMANPASYVGS